MIYRGIYLYGGKTHAHSQPASGNIFAGRLACESKIWHYKQMDIRPAKRVDWIYVISSRGEGPVKIGVSNNPPKRLRIFQVGSENELKIQYAEPVDGNAYKLEAMVHQALAMKRRQNSVQEWFDVSASQAQAKIVEMLKLMKAGITKLPEPPNKYKVLRERLGLSVADLAERAACKISSIEKLEAGKLSNLQEFQRIERVLNHIKDRKVRLGIF